MVQSPHRGGAGPGRPDQYPIDWTRLQHQSAGLISIALNTVIRGKPRHSALSCWQEPKLPPLWDTAVCVWALRWADDCRGFQSSSLQRHLTQLPLKLYTFTLTADQYNQSAAQTYYTVFKLLFYQPWICGNTFIWDDSAAQHSVPLQEIMCPVWTECGGGAGAWLWSVPDFHTAIDM